MKNNPLYPIVGFFVIAGVIIYGVVKGWFKSAKSSSTATGLNIPDIKISTGSSSSGGGSYTYTPTTPDPDPVTPTQNVDLTAVSKTNLVKTIANQTGLNTLNLSAFGTMNVKTFSDNGYLRPVWAIYMDITGKWFADNAKKPWQLGIAGSNNINASNGGWGVNGQDFFNPFELSTYLGFTSNVPYQFRAQGDVGYGPNQPPFDANSTLLNAFDAGAGIASSIHFGAGDNVAGGTFQYGISKRGAVWFDGESGDENGSDKHRAVLMGLATNTYARVFNLYGLIFITLGYYKQGGSKFYHYYPDSNGNFDNSANISVDWRPNTVLSIPERGISNKKLTDYPNIVPSFEQSFHKVQVARQGSNYYLDTNNTNYVVINKFGSNANVDHPMAALGFNLEIHKWYCVNKLSNRDLLCMAKMVCDRGQLGAIESIVDSTGTARADNSANNQNYQVGRKYAFAFTSLVYMCSSHLMAWDKAQDTHEGGSDTYLGVFGVHDLVAKSGGIDCIRDLTPRLWDSEYSLDGTTWKKTKAIDWDESTTTVLAYRDKIGYSSGAYKWEVMSWRTEGVEPTEFWARATINGTLRTIHVTPNMWETTNPAYSGANYTGANLGNIPTADKEYFYQLYTFTS